MVFDVRYPIRTAWLPTPSKRRPGIAIGPKVRFIVAHDTGNPASTAAGNVRYYANTAQAESASAHLFVDDKEIVECIPALTAAPEKAWHVRYAPDADNRLFGVDADDAAIGVEYCYGGAIDADAAYRRYVWTIACLCDRYDLDPAKDVVGHFFLDPGRKTDPVTGLAASRRTYEQLLRDIVSEHQACRGEAAVAGLATSAGTGNATSSVRLNLRRGAPSTRAPVARVVPPGTALAYVASSREGEAVNGNSLWYRTAADEWFWGGGVALAA